MDPFKLLKADHRNVEALFDELESANGKAKMSVFEQIKTELELHTHIEEKIFYPAVEKPRQTHDLTMEAYEEHDGVKKLLRELSRARTANDEWEAKAKVLRENVEHHVEEEENQLFPKASDVLSEEDIDDLGERMQAEKSRKQRGQASKASSSKKSSKKTAGKTKSTKKSGSKKGESKGTSKSSASKTTKRSGSKKSGKKGRSKKAGKKGRR